jgi:hypothetical protein
MLSVLSENNWQGATALAAELKIEESEAIESLQNLNATQEHHSIPHELSQIFNLDEPEAARAFIKSFVITSPTSAEIIRYQIENALG